MDMCIKQLILINNKIYIGQHKSKYFNKHYFGSGHLIETTINKGFKEIWWESGRSYAAKYFHINFVTFERCMKLADCEETPEHRHYIRSKNHKSKK